MGYNTRFREVISVNARGFNQARFNCHGLQTMAGSVAIKVTHGLTNIEGLGRHLREDGVFAEAIVKAADCVWFANVRLIGDCAAAFRVGFADSGAFIRERYWDDLISSVIRFKRDVRANGLGGCRKNAQRKEG